MKILIAITTLILATAAHAAPAQIIYSCDLTIAAVNPTTGEVTGQTIDAGNFIVGPAGDPTPIENKVLSANNQAYTLALNENNAGKIDATLWLGTSEANNPAIILLGKGQSEFGHPVSIVGENSSESNTHYVVLCLPK